MSWIEEAHQEALAIIGAIGLSPHDIVLGSAHVDGDTLTVQEFARDADGHRYKDEAGGGDVKRERTYRLHRVELIHKEQA